MKFLGEIMDNSTEFEIRSGIENMDFTWSP